MKNVETIYGTDSYGPFRYCKNLKYIWIGSAITDLERYSLATYGSNATEDPYRIYIDLPKATVKTFSGYSYYFVDDYTKSSIIICNDKKGARRTGAPLRIGEKYGTFQ